MDLFIGVFFDSFGHSIPETTKIWTTVRIFQYYIFSPYNCTYSLLFLLNYYYHRNINNCGQAELYLGRSERKFFVNVVLKLIDRGQYSKNNDLSATVAAAISRLSYVEPSLVLPFVASRYYIALETVSAVGMSLFAVCTLKILETNMNNLWFFSLTKKHLFTFDSIHN